MGKDREPTKLSAKEVEMIIAGRVADDVSFNDISEWRRKDLVSGLVPGLTTKRTLDEAMMFIGDSGAGILSRQKVKKTHGPTHRLGDGWTTDELLEYIEHPPKSPDD